MLDVAVSPDQAKLMRTTITLDRDVYEAAVNPARSSGERLGKAVCELARRGLTKKVIDDEGLFQPAFLTQRFVVEHE